MIRPMSAWTVPFRRLILLLLLIAAGEFMRRSSRPLMQSAFQNALIPGVLTAAGTLTPAKVFVIGAGVAGLQAIATARRLGASVFATDVRPEVKEQIESVGARYVGIELKQSASAGGGYVFQRRNLATAADGCASGNITHNGKWNLSTGDYGVGYNDTAGTGMFSSGSPGDNDVTLDADPFVDRTRRLSTWAIARGYSAAGDYATQVADAYTALKTDPATRITDLFEYVQNGWKVNAATLNGAAHDGGAPGALSYVPRVAKAQLGMNGGFDRYMRGGFNG